MKGVSSIREERSDQIMDQGETIKYDVDNNSAGQLPEAASMLAFENIEDIHGIEDSAPEGWDYDQWNKMINKSYRDRLVIAGALIAAEIDRVQAIERSISNVDNYTAHIV